MPIRHQSPGQAASGEVTFSPSLDWKRDPGVFPPKERGSESSLRPNLPLQNPLWEKGRQGWREERARAPAVLRKSNKERVFTTNFVKGRAVTGITQLDLTGPGRTPAPILVVLFCLSNLPNRVGYLLSLSSASLPSAFPLSFCSVQGNVLLTLQNPLFCCCPTFQSRTQIEVVL